MKPSTPLTLTIGIPAYNEEDNLGSLLNSLASQKTALAQISQIFVLNDGSTDQTLNIARAHAQNNPLLTILSDNQRLGRRKRIEQLISLSQSDITLVLDADILPQDKFLTHSLTAPFNDPLVVAVSADRKPLPATGLVEDLINIWDQMWADITSDIKGGHNIFHTFSCALAMRTSFVKAVNFPSSLISEARYLYFKALSTHHKFIFAPSAVVLYRSPSTLSEYIRRLKRAKNQRHILSSEFGSLVSEESPPIPLSAKIPAIFKNFLTHPLKLPLSTILHLVLQKLPYWETEFARFGYWTTLPSTKKLMR